MHLDHAMIPVPFRGATLFLVDEEGEPFVPMRPLVEGMGLDWKSQHRKLTGSGSRWVSVVVMMTTTGADGKQYEMLCMALRKLPAWLFSVDPNKVAPCIRDNIIAYQNECDDVLWEYWTKGQVGPRDGGLPVAAFHGHEPGSIRPVNREFFGWIEFYRYGFGYSERCARARAAEQMKTRHGIDVGVLAGLDLTKVCPDNVMQAEQARLEYQREHPLLPEFWRTYWMLEGERPHSVNHSKNHSLIAININQFLAACHERGVDPPEALLTKRILKESTSPRFLEQRAVLSAITGTTVKCWVFGINS